jgi:ABC-type Fe3+/spermidine/putrescine transport system ATPase subunit
VFELRDLRHAYDSTEVLNVPAWEAGSGAHWLVVGPSGSGNTTLLRIIAGILRPTAGTVRIAGQDLGALSAAALYLFRGRPVQWDFTIIWREPCR